jgi:WD40 repeat protein
MSDLASNPLTRLLLDQSERWRRDTPLSVEAYLQQHPWLAAKDDDLLDLISNEIYLRLRRGEKPDPADYRRRFPRLADQIDLQFQLHKSAGPSLPSLPRGSLPGLDASPVVPGYEVMEELGRGAMGVVYKARQLSLRRVVALKVMQSTGRINAAQQARFRAEAEAVASLQHPNIVQIFEVGEHDHRAYFSLELVDGGSLAARLTGAPMPQRDAARLIETLARAVAYAHQRGVIHRDLKPANVLLTADNTPKITDFGLAKRLESGLRLTRLGDILGTPSYMAPEQARGKPREVGTPADLYALGAILYETLTGRPPFREDTGLATLLKAELEEVDPPSRLRRGLSPDLEAICLKCLRKHPEDRYATATALADELGRYLAGRPVQARPVGAGTRFLKWVRRAPTQAALLFVALVAAALLITSGLIGGARLQDDLDRAVAEKTQLTRERDAALEKLKDVDDRRDAVLKMQKDVEEQRAIFREARGETERHRQMARQRLEQARRGLYALQLSEAGSLWRHDPERARRLLEDTARCPLDLRDFTWSLLWRGADRRRRQLHGRGGTVLALAADPEGRVLASGSADGTVRLWDVEAGREKTVLRGHKGRVNAVSYASKGSLLASGSSDWSVRLWDVDGKFLRALDGHQGPVFAVAVNPMATLIASAGEDGAIRLWLPSGKVEGELSGHRDAVHALAFSPDGKTLASAGEERAIVLWDVEAKKVLRVLPGHAGRVYSLAFAPDGKTLASGGADGTVRLCDIRDPAGSSITLGVHAGLVYSVAFSPDGRSVASAAEGMAGYNEEPGGEVKLWDLVSAEARATFATAAGAFAVTFACNGKRLAAATGRDVELCPADVTLERTTLRPHNGVILALALSPDGHMVFTGGTDGAIKRTDSTTGMVLQTLTKHKGAVTTLALAPDGGTLASGGVDGMLHFWDTEGGEHRKEQADAHAGTISCLTFAPDGKMLASGGHDRRVKLWDPIKSQLLRALPAQPDAVTCVAFAPDGKALATACEDGTIKLWRTATGAPIRTVAAAGKGVQALAFAPDGATLAAGGYDGTVRLWETTTWSECGTLTGHRGTVWSLAFSPDGRTLAAAAGPEEAGRLQNGGEVRLWDPIASVLRAVLIGHSQAVVAVAFSKDGRTLASASLDHTVKLWETGAADISVSLPRHAVPIRALAICGDGRTLICAGGLTAPPSESVGKVTLWDAATGKERTVVTNQSGPMTSLAVSPDGKLGASGGVAGEIKLWNANTGKEKDVAPRRHAGPVLALTFGPNGKLLVSGGWDGVVRLHDVDSGKEQAVLHGHTGPVLALAVSPDGRQIASASWDGTVRLWPVSGDKGKSVLRGHAGPVRAIAFGPGGKLLASGAGSFDRLHHDRIGEVIVWNTTTGKKQTTIKAHIRPVIAVGFEGQTLVTVAESGPNGRSGVRTWDVDTGKRRTSHTGPDKAIIFAALPSGRPLLLADRGQESFVWDASTGKERAKLDLRKGRTTAATFNSDGSIVVTATVVQRGNPVHSGEARAWDVRTGEPLAALREMAEVCAAAVTKDGALAALGFRDGKVRLWDPLTGKVHFVLVGHEGAVDAVALSPDGRTLVTGGADGKLRFWDTGKGDLLATQGDHEGAITALAFSPDGNLVVSTGDDGAIRLWDGTNSKTRGVLARPGAIVALAMAPDGHTLATLGRDGTVLAWNLAESKPTGKLGPETLGAKAMAFSCDSRRLILADRDGNLHEWEVETGKKIAAPPRRHKEIDCLAVLPNATGVVTGGIDRMVRLWSNPQVSSPTDRRQ